MNALWVSRIQIPYQIDADSYSCTLYMTGVYYANWIPDQVGNDVRELNIKVRKQSHFIVTHWRVLG